MDGCAEDLHPGVGEFETLGSVGLGGGLGCVGVGVRSGAGGGWGVVEDCGAGALDVESGFGCGG